MSNLTRSILRATTLGIAIGLYLHFTRLELTWPILGLVGVYAVNEILWEK